MAKKTYIATVSVPILVRVSVEAENIDEATISAVYAADMDMVIDAAQWGRFDSRNVQVTEIEVGEEQ